MGSGRVWVAVALVGLLGTSGHAVSPPAEGAGLVGAQDGGLGAQRAIEAARFLPERDPTDPFENGARVQVEDRFPRAMLVDLERRGHRFQKIGRKGEVRYGYAAAVLVDVAAHTVEGGAEPRRSHAAVAAESSAAAARH